MTRNDVLANIELYCTGRQTEKEDSEVVERVLREVTHGHLIDRIFHGVDDLPLEMDLDGAIVEAIVFMDRLAASAPLPELYRVKLMKMEAAMTRQEVARAVTDLRSDQFNLEERVERLWRLLDDFPHAEIGDLIYRDTQGLTPDQVVDEAVRRQVAHLRTLFREDDPRRTGG